MKLRNKQPISAPMTERKTVMLPLDRDKYDPKQVGPHRGPTVKAARRAVLEAAQSLLRDGRTDDARSALRCAWTLTIRTYYLIRSGKASTTKLARKLPSVLRETGYIDRDTYDKLVAVSGLLKCKKLLDLQRAHNVIAELEAMIDSNHLGEQTA